MGAFTMAEEVREVGARENTPLLYQIRFTKRTRMYRPGEAASFPLPITRRFTHANPPCAVLEGYWEDDVLHPGIKQTEETPAPAEATEEGAPAGTQNRSMQGKAAAKKKPAGSDS